MICLITVGGDFNPEQTAAADLLHHSVTISGPVAIEIERCNGMHTDALVAINHRINTVVGSLIDSYALDYNVHDAIPFRIEVRFREPSTLDASCQVSLQESYGISGFLKLPDSLDIPVEILGNLLSVTLGYDLTEVSGIIGHEDSIAEEAIPIRLAS